jgi:oligopeptide transport system ATP-binding protein
MGRERAVPLLNVDNLRTYFHTRNGIVRAVDGISFSIAPGETLGIVGESGSGKSVASYTLLRLVSSPPGRIESGAAAFEQVDLLRCSNAELRGIRGKRISMVFQDPMTALNPYLTIGEQVMEPLRIHENASTRAARDRAIAALESVGIPDASRCMTEYPHQFSGGMRQRVMIAAALITKPRLLIADEPTTALDVTVQAQILGLIKRRQQELGMALLLITHNLGVIAGTCDRVLVMYAGVILESAPVRRIFYESKHPYTKALLGSMPSLHRKGETLYTIPGLPPDLSKEVAGCPFAPRCTHAVDLCRRERPVLQEVAPEQASACLRVQAGDL